MAYVNQEDLKIINDALLEGADVRIQRTPNGGCRIVKDFVTVLKKTGGNQNGAQVPRAEETVRARYTQEHRR